MTPADARAAAPADARAAAPAAAAAKVIPAGSVNNTKQALPKDSFTQDRYSRPTSNYSAKRETYEGVKESGSQRAKQNQLLQNSRKNLGQ